MNPWHMSHKGERHLPMNTTAIEQEVERTLGLLETLEKIPASPFFYTRLKAHMNAQAQKRRMPIARINLRESLVAAGAVLLLFVNIYTILHSTHESQVASKNTTLSSFANVYALDNDSY
jgi:hypothetical protein